MDLHKARKIGEAIQKVVSRGEQYQWCGLTHLAKEASMNRQTVWRYLKVMEKDGLVYKVERTWRGETAYRYYLTSAGKKYVASFKELPLGSVTK